MDFSEGIQAPLSDVFGRISLENHEASYVSGAHWIAILDGIAELKNHFEDNHEPSPYDSGTELGPPPIEKPVLLFGANKYAIKQDILSNILLRPIVDRLISGFLSAMDMAPVDIYGPTIFKRERKVLDQSLGCTCLVDWHVVCDNVLGDPVPDLPGQ